MLLSDACLDTPSENPGLLRLPDVYSAFQQESAEVNVTLSKVDCYFQTSVEVSATTYNQTPKLHVFNVRSLNWTQNVFSKMAYRFKLFDYFMFHLLL